MDTEDLAQLDVFYADGRYLEAGARVAELQEKSGTAVFLKSLENVDPNFLGRLSRSVLHSGQRRLSAILSFRAARMNELTESGRAFWSYYSAGKHWDIDEALSGYVIRASAAVERESAKNTALLESLCLSELLQARIASDWRDFPKAEERLKAAEFRLPGSLMVASERAFYHYHRFELDLARETLSSHSVFSKPETVHSGDWGSGNDSVQRLIARTTLAYLHIQSDRGDLALEVLESEPSTLLSLFACELYFRAATLVRDRGRCATVLEAMEKFRVSIPRSIDELLSARRGFLAELSWYRETPEPEQIDLPLRFGVQDFHNCAPASISSVLGFLGEDLSQEDLASQMTWNGTDPQEERTYFLERGYEIRSFGMDLATARALAAKGVPALLTLRGSENSHMVALTGYSGDRLLILDPNIPHRIEFPYEDYRKKEDSHACHANVYLPPEKRGLLDDLVLPDEKIHQAYDSLFSALKRNDPVAVESARAEIETSGPGHPLVLWGNLYAASFAGQADRAFRAAEELRSRFPDSDDITMTILALHRRWGGQSKSRAYIASCLEAQTDNTLYLRELVSEDLNLGRPLAELAPLMHRLKERCGPNAQMAELVARYERARGGDPLPWLRRAATIDDRNEDRLSAYLNATSLRREVLEFLPFAEMRVRPNYRLGLKTELGLAKLRARLGEVEESLENARRLAIHPSLEANDGLAAELAAFFLEWGRPEPALELMGSHPGHFHPQVRRNLRFDAALQRDDRQTIRELMNEWENNGLWSPDVLDRYLRASWSLDGPEPTIDRAVAIVDNSSGGPELAECATRFVELDGPSLRREVLSRWVRRWPESAWMSREYALVLVRESLFEEALALLADLRRRFPDDPYNCSVQADAFWKAGKSQEAWDLLEKAVDRFGPMSVLVNPLLFQRPHARASSSSLLEKIGQALLEKNHEPDLALNYFLASRIHRRASDYISWARSYVDRWKGELGAQLITFRMAIFEFNEPDAYRHEAESARDVLLGLSAQEEAWIEASSIARILDGTAAYQRVLEGAHGLNPSWNRISWQLAEHYRSVGQDEKCDSLKLAIVLRLPLVREIQEYAASLSSLDETQKLRAAESAHFLDPSLLSGVKARTSGHGSWKEPGTWDEIKRVYEGFAGARALLEFDAAIEENASLAGCRKLLTDSGLDANEPRFALRAFRLRCREVGVSQAVGELSANDTFLFFCLRSEALNWVSGIDDLEERKAAIARLERPGIIDGDSARQRAMLLAAKTTDFSGEKAVAYRLYFDLCPGEAGAWYAWTLASQLDAKSRVETQFFSLDTALKLSPNFSDAAKKYVEILEKNGLKSDEFVSSLRKDREEWAWIFPLWSMAYRKRDLRWKAEFGGIVREIVYRTPLSPPRVYDIYRFQEETGIPVSLLLQGTAHLKSIDGVTALELVLRGKEGFHRMGNFFDPERDREFGPVSEAVLPYVLRDWLTKHSQETGFFVAIANSLLKAGATAFLRGGAAFFEKSETAWRNVTDFAIRMDLGKTKQELCGLFGNFTLDAWMAGALIWDFLAGGDLRQARKLKDSVPSLMSDEAPVDSSLRLASAIIQILDGKIAGASALMKDFQADENNRNQELISHFLAESLKVFENPDYDLAAYRKFVRTWIPIAWARKIIYAGLAFRKRNGFIPRFSIESRRLFTATLKFASRFPTLAAMVLVVGGLVLVGMIIAAIVGLGGSAPFPVTLMALILIAAFVGRRRK